MLLVNGGWSEWINGTECVKLPSEMYVMNMTRYCNNPEPIYGGACLISNLDNSTGMEEVKEVICEVQGKQIK